jgi:hypothetical protein
MELATFGAVLTFAIDFEARLGALYTALGASIPAMAAEMAQGAAACARRGTLLERVRRENVTEMILEPIHGYDSNDYVLPAPRAALPPPWARQAGRWRWPFTRPAPATSPSPRSSAPSTAWPRSTPAPRGDAAGG